MMILCSAGEAGLAIPAGCWQVGSSKAAVLCMTNTLSAWNLQLDEAANECQALTMQMLTGLQEELASKRSYICMLLDALTLLDLLSGAVAFMAGRKHAATFCCPHICSQAGGSL